MKKKTVNRRVDVAPVGGLSAPLGFYTRPVQKVVKRWKGKIEDQLLEDYFVRVALCVLGTRSKLEFGFIIKDYWPFIFEVGTALTKVVEKESPAKWLLLLPISVQKAGVNSSWGEIALEIKKCGGPLYETDALMKQAERMKILTPVEVGIAHNKQKPKIARTYKVKMSFRSLTEKP